MKFFRKMDEMEMYINFKALRLTYIFILVFLICRLTYIIVSSGFEPTEAFRSWEFFLLITQNLILIGSRLIMNTKMGNDGEQ